MTSDFLMKIFLSNKILFSGLWKPSCFTPGLGLFPRGGYRGRGGLRGGRRPVGGGGQDFAFPSGVNLPLSLLWARFSFRPEHSLFANRVLDLLSPAIQDFRLNDLLLYLLLLSYTSQTASRRICISNLFKQNL